MKLTTIGKTAINQLGRESLSLRAIALIEQLTLNQYFARYREEVILQGWPQMHKPLKILSIQGTRCESVEIDIKPKILIYIIECQVVRVRS